MRPTRCHPPNSVFTSEIGDAKRLSHDSCALEIRGWHCFGTYNADNLVTKVTITNNEDTSIRETEYKYEDSLNDEILYWSNEMGAEDGWCKTERKTREYSSEGVLQETVTYTQKLNESFETECDVFETSSKEVCTYNSDNQLELIEVYFKTEYGRVKSREFRFEWTETGNSWFFKTLGGSNFANPISGISPMQPWMRWLYGANPNYYAR